MKKKELAVEYVPKEQLKAYANNAKLHTAEQVEAIKKSIEQFGFNDPIAIWKNNEIVEGHGRLLAAMEMDDIKQVPIIRLDHLTDKQRKAYIIAHNKTSLLTNFDNDLLGEELKDIVEDFDMTDFGFGDFELTMLTEDF
jgi:ParB-like chromosome segregation protein Spo0J